MAAPIVVEDHVHSPAPLPIFAGPSGLKVRFIKDIPSGHAQAGCGSGTDDGCDPTCPSSCVSHG